MEEAWFHLLCYDSVWYLDDMSIEKKVAVLAEGGGCGNVVSVYCPLVCVYLCDFICFGYLRWEVKKDENDVSRGM